MEIWCRHVLINFFGPVSFRLTASSHESVLRPNICTTNKFAANLSCGNWQTEMKHAKHQHASIVVVSMPMLAFSSNLGCASVQPQRAASTAVGRFYAASMPQDVTMCSHGTYYFRRGKIFGFFPRALRRIGK